MKENPEAAKDSRYRIEHAQILDELDIPRFAQMGVNASMQGIHCTSDRPQGVKQSPVNERRQAASLTLSRTAPNCHAGSIFSSYSTHGNRTRQAAKFNFRTPGPEEHRAMAAILGVIQSLFIIIYFILNLYYKVVKPCFSSKVFNHKVHQECTKDTK